MSLLGVRMNTPPPEKQEKVTPRGSQERKQLPRGGTGNRDVSPTGEPRTETSPPRGNREQKRLPRGENRELERLPHGETENWNAGVYIGQNLTRSSAVFPHVYRGGIAHRAYKGFG